jgi:hypothetical protein
MRSRSIPRPPGGSLEATRLLGRQEAAPEAGRLGHARPHARRSFPRAVTQAIDAIDHHRCDQVREAAVDFAWLAR